MMVGQWYGSLDDSQHAMARQVWWHFVTLCAIFVTYKR